MCTVHRNNLASSFCRPVTIELVYNKCFIFRNAKNIFQLFCLKNFRNSTRVRRSRNAGIIPLTNKKYKVKTVAEFWFTIHVEAYVHLKKDIFRMSLCNCHCQIGTCRMSGCDNIMCINEIPLADHLINGFSAACF